MKKIMFDDKYGLTQAVIEGRKTMTRRAVPEKLIRVIEGGSPGFAVMESKYKVGEVVAVAQNYEQAGWMPDVLQQVFVDKPTIFPDLDKYSSLCGWIDLPFKYHKGWTNKMFVRADLMPHQIRITNIRVERLRDISDEECMKEGIREKSNFPHKKSLPFYFDGGKHSWDNSFSTPRQAFAALIDKVFGKGTWDSNPWVFVYEFELVK